MFTDLNVKMVGKKVIPSPIGWWNSEFCFCVCVLLLVKKGFCCKKKVYNENIQLMIGNNEYFHRFAEELA